MRSRSRTFPPDRLGQIIGEIAAGTAHTGQAFFESLVLCLSRALGARYAFVGELMGPQRDIIRTLGLASEGSLQPEMVYELADTPCANVLCTGLCYYPSKVASLFPNDHLLLEMGVESYLGVPLVSAGGQALGILVVLHDASLDQSVDPAGILRIFAARAGAELERLGQEREALDREERLRASEERLSKVFRSSPDAIIVSTVNEGRFLEINRSCERLFGYAASEMIGRTSVELGLWRREEDRLRLVQFIQQSGGYRDEVVEMLTRGGELRMCVLSAEAIVVGAEACLVVVIRDVSEAIQQERRVLESEERLRLALDAARMGAWEWEVAGDRVTWSERENVVCGFAPGTRISTLEDYLARMHPQDLPRLRGAVERAVAGVAEQYVSEHRLIGQDGIHRWVETRGKVFHDESGRAQRLAGTIADITGRKRIEADLRASEDRWRRLSEAAFEGIAISQQGRIVDANVQLSSMLGYSQDEMVGRNVLDLVAPESAAEVQRHVATGSSEPYEHIALRKDGSRFPVGVRGRTFISDEDRLRVTAVRDLTEHKRLESELRAAAREWNECFDALPVGLLIVGSDFRIRRANRPALELAGRREFKELLGLSLSNVGVGEPWASLSALARGVAVDVPGEEVVDHRTGTAWRLSSSELPRDEGEAPWTILLFRDVTDVARLRDALSRQAALAAMGSLVAGVAHEVRTPLFSMSATLDAFEGGTLEELEEGTRLLRAQLRRLSNLMKDLLEYGRPPTLQSETGTLGVVIARAFETCSQMAEEAGVRLESALPEDLPDIERDAPRLEQAFQNLVANAVQHSPRGSTVRVSATVVKDKVECRVEDRGSGLDEAMHLHVFEPFFSRRKGGTGLGLSIVQQIVEAHGGSVSAGNRPGGGASFLVELPVGRRSRG